MVMDFSFRAITKIAGFFTLFFGLLKLYSLKYTDAPEFDVIVASTLLYISTKLLL